LTILSEENINQYRLEQFVRDLTIFHNIKTAIQGNHINIIQKSLQKLNDWTNSNELNTVPDLTITDNVLQNNIESLLNNDLSEEFLNLLGKEFNQKSGLKSFIDNQKINSKLIQTLKIICINIVHNFLKENLSDEEFELGYQIYKLESSIPKDFFNLFINNPGIDNLSFDVETVDVKNWLKITSTSQFLEHLNQIGINENLKFDYDSEKFYHYNSSIEIQNQSFQIRDQLYNSVNVIENVLKNL